MDFEKLLRRIRKFPLSLSRRGQQESQTSVRRSAKHRVYEEGICYSIGAYVRSGDFNKTNPGPLQINADEGIVPSVVDYI